VVNCCGSVVGIQCYIHINRRIFLLLFKQMSGRFMFLIHDEVLTKVAWKIAPVEAKKWRFQKVRFCDKNVDVISLHSNRFLIRQWDPIRFHSFDVSPYQSGSKTVCYCLTVLLYGSTFNVKTSVLWRGRWRQKSETLSHSVYSRDGKTTFDFKVVFGLTKNHRETTKNYRKTTLKNHSAL
jgi:hypothetical protein